MSNSSQYRGVYWNKRRGKFLSVITVNGRRAELGGFKTERLAALAYDRVAVRYGYTPNILKQVK